MGCGIMNTAKKLPAVEFHAKSRPLGSSHSPAVLLCLLALAVPVKPLANEVANYACCDRHKETLPAVHCVSPPSHFWDGEGQHGHYNKIRQTAQEKGGRLPSREETKNPQSHAALGIFAGGDSRTRICDLSRVRRALYQLSYASVLVTRTGLEPVLPP